MSWRIISFCILLAFGWGNFIPHAQGMEINPSEDEPPRSLYQKAINNPKEIYNSPDLQDDLIHQVLYEHYSLTPQQIKPCISLTKLCEKVNQPLLGSGDEGWLINAKIFFLRYGKDLFYNSWTLSFDSQQFYKDMGKLELEVTTHMTVPSAMNSSHSQTNYLSINNQEVIDTTPKPSLQSSTALPLDETNQLTPQQYSTVSDPNPYLTSIICFLKGVYEEIDGRFFIGSLSKAKDYYDLSLRYYDLTLGWCLLPQACFEIARIHECGIKDILLSNLEVAKNLYTFAAVAPDPRAAFALSCICETEKKFDEAFSWALKAAKLGHSQAQFKVGLFYHKGRGVEQNDKKARRWYEFSRQQGNLEADLHFARHLWLGRGGDKDLKGAFEIYERLANQDYCPKAVYTYGYFYLEGLHVPKDKDKAKPLIEKAAKLGREYAWNALAACFYTGVEQRNAYETAIKLYQERKSKPFTIAITNLAITLIASKDTDVDLPKAQKLLQEIANNPRGQYQLGRIAEKQKNILEAKEHYQTAASQGDTESTRRLVALEKHPQVVWKWRYALATAGNKDDYEGLQKYFAEDFWLDRYLFTLKGQDATGLKGALETSFKTLQTAAQDIPQRELFSVLSVPFYLFEKPGFLITCVYFNNKQLYQEPFHEETGCKPFVIGSRSYLVFENSSIKRLNDFINKSKAIDEHLAKVGVIESSLKEEAIGKYRTLRQAYQGFTQVWEEFVEGTLSKRNQLFFNTFNGVLWPIGGTSPEGPVWTDDKDNKYWKDLYALTMKTQNGDHLKKAWEDSLLNLKNAAQETLFQPLVLSLNIPFDLFNKHGFLITIGRIKYPEQYQKQSNCQPFQIGSQYYLVVNNGVINEFNTFLSNIEIVEEKLKIIDSLGTSVKEEDKQKYSLVRQNLNRFKRAQEAYIVGTLPQRNQAFFDNMEKKNEK